MRTVLTIKEQQEFLDANWQFRTLVHKWSARGMGNSKILDCAGTIIGKAGGCGYDRYGTALGNAMLYMFPAELLKLAKRECKKGNPAYNVQTAKNFYGLHYYPLTEKVLLNGATGSECMKHILRKIGFSLNYVGELETSVSGEAFYTLTPLTKHERQYLKS